jgi:serine protease
MKKALFACALFIMSACNSITNQQQTSSDTTVTIQINQHMSPRWMQGRAQPATNAEGLLEHAGRQMGFFNNRVIVQINPNDTQAADAVFKQQGATVLDQGQPPAPPASLPMSKRRTVPDRGFRLISVPTGSVDLTILAKRLERRGVRGAVKLSSERAARALDFALGLQESNPRVIQSSELDWIMPTNAPDDHSVGSGYLQPTSNDALVSLNLPGTDGAWARRTGSSPIDGRGVGIAIIDTGFDADNYEIQGFDPILGTQVNSRAVYQYDFEQSDYNVDVGPTEDCETPGNKCYHGTGSATAAAGTLGNHFGGAGSAPKADLMLFRDSAYFWGSRVNNFWLAARAVDTALAWGADVISMSFGLNSWVLTCGDTVIICYLQNSISNAENYGVVVLASAGNDNCRSDGFYWGNPCFATPGAWDNVISVGAHDKTFFRSRWGTKGSIWGATVDIWAPGGGSRVSNFTHDQLFGVPTPDYPCYVTQQCVQFNNENKLFFFNGTSAASPYAAGVVALMKQVRPSLNHWDAKNILNSTGKTSPDTEVGKIIDAKAAIEYLGARLPGQNQPPFISFSPLTSEVEGIPYTGAWNAYSSYDPDGSIVSYSWQWGDGTSSSGVTSNHTYTRAGTFTITLTIRDNAGQTVTKTGSLVLTRIIREPPDR